MYTYGIPKISYKRFVEKIRQKNSSKKIRQKNLSKKYIGIPYTVGIHTVGIHRGGRIAILGCLNPAPYWRFFFQMLFRLFQS